MSNPYDPDSPAEDAVLPFVVEDCQESWYVQFRREHLRMIADAFHVSLNHHVNTARLVRAAATVPEICVHHVRLGQGCFCPRCPTAPSPTFA